MNNEITVALVASVASVFVAIIGVITSLISNRQSSRSESAIEKLKFEFLRLSSKDKIIDEQLGRSLEALQEALQVIQQVKDETQLLLSGLDTSLSANAMIRRIATVREAIFACYEKRIADLNDSEDRVFHRAKNIAFSIENYAKNTLQIDQESYELSGQQRQRLETLRHELTEIQGILRDSRTERLLKRIAHEPQKKS